MTIFFYEVKFGSNRKAFQIVMALLGLTYFFAGIENAFKDFVFLPGEVSFIMQSLAPGGQKGTTRGSALRYRCGSTA